MNADFLVLKVLDEVSSLNELRDGEAHTLGTREEVRAQIGQALPSVRWQEEALGVWWSGEVFSIEIRLPDEEPVHSLTLKVRMHPIFGADAWLPDEEKELEGFLLALCDAAGWTLFDLGSGRRFEFRDELEEEEEAEPPAWHEAGPVN